MISDLTLWRMALAFSQQEGAWDFMPDDKPNRPQRNRNPCDLRPPARAPNFWLGQLGVDPGGFAIFPNLSTGFRAALTNFRAHLLARPNQTMSQYIAGDPASGWPGYAPASDGNDPMAYCRAVCEAMRITPETRLGDLQ